MEYKLLHQSTITDQNAKVGFKIRTNFLNVIKGTFENIQGELLWDFMDLSENTIVITADASSLKTSMPERDVMFKSSHHLHSWEHPQLTLIAKNFIHKEGSYYAVATVTIKGVSQEALFKVTYDNESNTLKGSLSINRFDFALGQESTLYKDTIYVKIKIAL